MSSSKGVPATASNPDASKAIVATILNPDFQAFLKSQGAKPVEVQASVTSEASISAINRPTTPEVDPKTKEQKSN